MRARIKASSRHDGSGLLDAGDYIRCIFLVNCYWVSVFVSKKDLQCDVLGSNVKKVLRGRKIMLLVYNELIGRE